MKEMDRLVHIMETLRAPGGCPWDAEQNHKSLLPGLLEEAYELAEAIENEDPDAMEEELGDVLLQVLFHSLIAKEDGDFTISEVISRLSDKLVYRHPHVFGEGDAADVPEVIANWDMLKNGEKGKTHRRFISDGIPRGLPALLYAAKIQSRAHKQGFDWEDTSGIIRKIREETDELEAAAAGGDPKAIEDEVGDIIFSAVNFARKIGLDPEAAVHRVNRRFAERFRRIEDEAENRGISVSEMPMEEKERIWQESK